MPSPRWIVCAGLLVLAIGCESDTMAGPEVTIKLGGEFCEMYPEPLRAALQQVAGVKTVDVEGRKGYAVVTGTAGSISLSELKAAVNDVHGEGWHCEVEGFE